MSDLFPEEETTDPTEAFWKRHYRVDIRTEDDKLVRMLYAGNRVERAWATLLEAIKQHPEQHYLMLHHTRIMVDWPRDKWMLEQDGRI